MIDIDLNAFAVPSNDIEWFQQHESMLLGLYGREIVAVEPVDDEEKESLIDMESLIANWGNRMKTVCGRALMDDILVEFSEQTLDLASAQVGMSSLFYRTMEDM